MRPHLLRPLLVLTFLLALNSWLALWTLVGGAYHLELMFWPWKLGLSLAMATLVTLLTARLASNRGPSSPGYFRMLAAVMVVVMLIAGLVTYYYHLNEPAEGDGSGDEQTLTSIRSF